MAIFRKLAAGALGLIAGNVIDKEIRKSTNDYEFAQEAVANRVDEDKREKARKTTKFIVGTAVTIGVFALADKAANALINPDMGDKEDEGQKLLESDSEWTYFIEE